MKKISAEIVADSISPQGHRITTMLLTYPRFIHGELMTHRVFSRNSASSRAIPFEKMVKMVEEDPFIPIAWQKDHKGMQGTEYVDELEASILATDWLVAANNAIKHAKKLHNGTELSTGRILSGTTKQLCNRLLEPFMWHTVLVTSTEWDNFFELRCPQYGGTDAKNNEVYFKSKKEAIKHLQEIGVNTVNLKEDDILGWLQINKSQAEIHIQALAESMWDAMNESTPKKLKGGEYHIPFGDNITMSILDQHDLAEKFPCISSKEDLKIRIATARCARLSYMTFDGKIDYEKDIKLHDQLLESKHFSPFEHCGKVMTQLEYRNFTKTTPFPDKNGYTESEGWCNNFRGFIQYRYLVERRGIEK